MTPRKGEPLQPPSPELLAAYVDGEFEGSDCLQAQKRAVEAWLDQHPEARADIAAWRRLKKVWQEAPPPGPADAAWPRVLAGVCAGVAQARKEAARKGRFPWGRWLTGGAAAAILLALVAGPGYRWLTAPRDGGPPAGPPPGGAAVEVLPVATADEVVIIRVAGDDTPTLVVGNPPVQGELVLAEDGEVVVTYMEPDINMNSPRPMIWVRGEAEEDE